MTESPPEEIKNEEDFPPAHMEIPPPPPVAPIYNDRMARVYQGDCLRILGTLMESGERFTAIVTDPPYCSGGVSVAEKARPTSAKYANIHSAEQRGLPDFAGDNRNQIEYLHWMTEVFRTCHLVATNNALLASFIDWRQLQVLMSAAAAANWIIKGVFVWDKTSASRPCKGWFRSQAEYIVMAVKGSFGSITKSVYLDGVWRGRRTTNDYRRQTAKPVELMMYLMQLLPDDAIVLDPFAGSGSTLVAAGKMGLQSVGIEYTSEYAAICVDRLREKGLFGNTEQSSYRGDAHV